MKDNITLEQLKEDTINILKEDMEWWEARYEEDTAARDKNLGYVCDAEKKSHVKSGGPFKFNVKKRASPSKLSAPPMEESMLTEGPPATGGEAVSGPPATGGEAVRRAPRSKKKKPET